VLAAAGGCEDNFLRDDERLQPWPTPTPDSDDPPDSVPSAPDAADLLPDDLLPDLPTPLLGDRDGDGVPDRADLWPDDPAWPGRALPGHVYTHTFDALYRAPSTEPFALAFVNALADLGSAGTSAPQYISAFDSALDPFGVLYVVTADAELLACQPDTARCRRVMRLPYDVCSNRGTPPNALTWARTLDQPEGFLVAVGSDQGCFLSPIVEAGDLKGFAAASAFRLPPGYTSGGDIVQADDGRLYLTAEGGGAFTDVLFSFNILNPISLGALGSLVGDFGDTFGVWGLTAHGRGRLLGWTMDGEVLEVWVLGDTVEVVSLGRVLLGGTFTGAASPPL
jgi:hypothetical protein